MIKISKEYWFVVVAGILSGLVVFGGKVLADLGLSLYEISVLPFAFASSILVFFILFKRECRFKTNMIGLLLLYGVVGLSIAIAQFGAVILGASVAVTVLLLYTQPFWTILFSYFFLKEKIVVRDLITLFMVLVGVFVLVNPFDNVLSGSWIGILLALFGGVALSGWVIVGSMLSKRGNNPINSLFSGNFLTVLFLLILYPLASRLIHIENLTRLSLDFDLTTWLIILSFGLLVGIANQLFYLKGVEKVPTVDAGLILMLEPIVGSLLAVVFLKQPLTFNIIIGGILILLANYLVLTKNKEAV